MQPKKLKRGQKAIRSKDCKVGDTVLHQGKAVMVTEILEEGKPGQRSYIACCAIHQDGTPLRRTLVACGTDWVAYRGET